MVMYGTVIDDLFIIVLTFISLFTSRFPALFIVAAGLLMVLTTYESFLEDKCKVLVAAEAVLMTVYAVLSGGFAGFSVFFLLKAVGEQIRVILGLCGFLFTSLMMDKSMPFAGRIVQMLLLAPTFFLLVLLYGLMDRMEKRKAREDERLIASNVSEMHEKRLNEQLVMQNFLAE